MAIILIPLIGLLIVMLAVNWYQSDKIRDLAQKSINSMNETKLLRQRNCLLEAENKALRNNIKGNQEIICYTCGGNGDCTEGCRFTAGADGCRKYWRYE